MFRFTCYNCNKVLKTRADKVGVVIECPRCKKPLQVPAPVAGAKRSFFSRAPVGRALPGRLQEAPGLARPVVRPRRRWIPRWLRPSATLVRAGIAGMLLSGLVYFFYPGKKPDGPPEDPKDSGDKVAKKETGASDPLEDLKSKDLAVRQQAVVALEKAGGGGKPAVKPLLEVLKDRSEAAPAVQLRKGAVKALAKSAATLPSDWQDSLAANLRLSIKDPNPEVRLLALDAMARTGKIAIPLVADCLSEQDPAVRIKAAEILAKMGPDARNTVPALLDAARRADLTTRVALAGHLVKLDPVNDAVIPILIDAFKTSDAGVRKAAAVALGEMGKFAFKAAEVPLYEVATKDKDEQVRDAATDALARVRGEK